MFDRAQPRDSSGIPFRTETGPGSLPGAIATRRGCHDDTLWFPYALGCAASTDDIANLSEDRAGDCHTREVAFPHERTASQLS